MRKLKVGDVLRLASSLPFEGTVLTVNKEYFSMEITQSKNSRFVVGSTRTWNSSSRTLFVLNPDELQGVDELLLKLNKLEKLWTTSK